MGEPRSREQPEHTHLSTELARLHGCGSLCPKTIKMAKHQRSLIRDPHNKYGNKTQKTEILRELPKCDTETGVSKCCWKMALIDLLSTGLPPTFNFLKKKHYLQNKIRQSIRKQGTPTLFSVGLEDQILFPCLGDTKNLCLEMTPNTGEGSKCSRTKLESKSISPNRTVKR